MLCKLIKNFLIVFSCLTIVEITQAKEIIYQQVIVSFNNELQSNKNKTIKQIAIDRVNSIKYNSISNSSISNGYLSFNSNLTKHSLVLNLPYAMTKTELKEYMNSLQKNNPDIKNFSPDYKIKVATLTANTLTHEILEKNPEYKHQFFIKKIEADYLNLWNSLNNDKKIKVAILDNGIVEKHEDLITNAASGFNCLNDNNGKCIKNGNVIDKGPKFHGTHVAGIIAAIPDNGKGIVGISGDHTDILPMKVLDNDGNGKVSYLIRAINNIADDNLAKIINMSLVADDSGSCPTALQEAIDRVYGEDILILSASGNNGKQASLYFPSNCSKVISISSIDKNNKITNYANYGNSVDFVSYGGKDDSNAIISTGGDNKYIYKYGTSQAAPMISGLINLILIKNKNESYSYTDVTNILFLTSSATEINCNNKNNCAGFGMVSIKKLNEVLNDYIPNQNPEECKIRLKKTSNNNSFEIYVSDVNNVNNPYNVKYTYVYDGVDYNLTRKTGNNYNYQVSDLQLFTNNIDNINKKVDVEIQVDIFTSNELKFSCSKSIDLLYNASIENNDNGNKSNNKGPSGSLNVGLVLFLLLMIINLKKKV